MVTAQALENDRKSKTEKEEGVIGRENAECASHIKSLEIMRCITHPEQDRGNEIAGNHEEQVHANPARASDTHDRGEAEDVMGEHGERSQCAQAVYLRNSFHWG